MKAFLVSLSMIGAVLANAGQPNREVRAAWLAPSIDASHSVAAVERVSDANFNTVLINMQTPSGVAWQSAYAKTAPVASIAREDVVERMIDAAHASHLEAIAVVTPRSLDDTAVYRELLVLYDFDGVMLDPVYLGDLTDDEVYDLIDSLTLELVNEFPRTRLWLRATPDREGRVKGLANSLLKNGIIENVVLTPDSSFPVRLIDEQWGATPGVTVVYDDITRASASRIMTGSQGIAWDNPDPVTAARIASTVFSDFAHLPSRDILPTTPDVPDEVRQEYDGKEYVLSWNAPRWNDADAPVTYYTVYENGRQLIGRVNGNSVTIPSSDPYRRFSVTSWDLNHGESEPVAAAVVSRAIDDSLLPSIDDASVTCANGLLVIKSRGVIGSIDIFNLEGMPVRSRRVNRNHASINVSDLPAGVYIVRYGGSDGHTVSKKFLIK